MKAPRIEIRRGRTGLYRFAVIAENGKLLATSEHYKSRQGAWRGAQALIDDCKRMYENPDGSIIDNKRG